MTIKTTWEVDLGADGFLTKGNNMAVLVELALENLGKLDDAAILRSFHASLSQAVIDCQVRWHDKRKRTVALVFTITPHDLTDNTCQEVNVSAQVHCAIPRQQSRTFVMAPRKGGKVVFHQDEPEDPNAHTLIDEIEERQKEKESGKEE